jgi:hypothetical protein
MDDTIISRPLPKRPETGLLAWLATIGYLGTEYSPDAMLTLRAAPQTPAQVVWSAAASWGQENVVVQERDSLPTALRDLWRAVEREHQIFKTLEAARRIPANYSQDKWVDAETESALDRLLGVTQAVFGQEWLLIIVYQPIENPSQRVHARLLAKDNSIHIGGTGPSIRDACLELYRNAAPGYFASAARQDDGGDFE